MGQLPDPHTFHRLAAAEKEDLTIDLLAIFKDAVIDFPLVVADLDQTNLLPDKLAESTLSSGEMLLSQELPQNKLSYPKLVNASSR